MENKIKEILENIKPGITDEESESLVDDGLLESLDVMNLMVMLEETFNIEVEPEDIMPDNFNSIGSITAMVERYLAE